MVEGQPGGPDQTDAQRNREATLRHRDLERGDATDLERGVSELQAARYETSLLRLMKRTGDNSQLINAMSDFLGGLDNLTFRGDGVSHLPANAEVVQKLTRFFAEGKNQLQFLVGGQPINHKPWIK